MFSARLLFFLQISAPIHNEDFRAKKQTYSLVGSGLQLVLLHESLRSNDSRRLYDERPVGRTCRTADASRLSAGFRAKKPSSESRQTHRQCYRPCKLSDVTIAKLSWMKRMRFSFAGPMLDLLPLEIIPVVLNIHSTGTSALIPRYTFPTTLSIGKEDWCFSQNHIFLEHLANIPCISVHEW